MAKQDVLVSPAYVYFAPVGEALPDETSVLPGAAWAGNWKVLGYTLTPVSVGVETEVFDLMVEQSNVPIRQTVTSKTVTIEMTLAEFTGQNLGLAFDASVVSLPAGASQHAFDTIDVLASQTAVSLYAFGIDAIRITDLNVKLPVRLFTPRASIRLNGAIEFSKGAGIGLPVAITALADSVDKALIIHNVTAPKTS